MKYVVISTNDNPDYVYYIPLISWAWQQLGWWPHVFFSGEDKPHVDFAFRSAFEEWDGTFVKRVDVPGYGSDTIAQVSRLYAACCFDNDVYLMTSDADMLPLSDYWKPNEKIITSWGHDLTSYQHIPICYVGMTAYIWREVMDIDYLDYNDVIEYQLKKYPQSKSTDRVKRWVTDQDIITERLRAFKPTVINRGTGSNGYPRGRVDRSAWSLNHKEFIDAHLYHGAWRKGNEWMFENIMQLLHRVWPCEDFSWFVEYTRKFREIAS